MVLKPITRCFWYQNLFFWYQKFLCWIILRVFWPFKKNSPQRILVSVLYNPLTQCVFKGEIQYSPSIGCTIRKAIHEKAMEWTHSRKTRWIHFCSSFRPRLHRNKNIVIFRFLRVGYRNLYVWHISDIGDWVCDHLLRNLLWWCSVLYCISAKARHVHIQS